MQTTDQQIVKQVLQLLGWDAGEHNTYIFDCAEKYLSGFIPSYPQIQSQILKSRVFWNWWRHHFEKRDMEFIEQCWNWNEGLNAKVELYKEIHDPRTLVVAVYMSGQVLEESYAQMIGDVIKEQQKEVAA
jgi:hypothetical protein